MPWIITIRLFCNLLALSSSAPVLPCHFVSIAHSVAAEAANYFRDFLLSCGCVKWCLLLCRSKNDDDCNNFVLLHSLLLLHGTIFHLTRHLVQLHYTFIVSLSLPLPPHYQTFYNDDGLKLSTEQFRDFITKPLPPRLPALISPESHVGHNGRRHRPTQGVIK